jgi:cell division transport system ATP-binding protein
MNQNLFLDFKNVEIKQQKNIILNEVNLSINKGEFVYFIGKTGSGKSSLLKAIYGDIFISNGDILFKNQSLRKLNIKKNFRIKTRSWNSFSGFSITYG